LAAEEVKVHSENKKRAHDISVVKEAEEVQYWKDRQSQNFNHRGPGALKNISFTK
jgi:hypothetical protein